MVGVFDLQNVSVIPHDGLYDCFPDDAATDERLEVTVAAASGELKPFDHHSSQVRLTTAKAYLLVDDKTFGIREGIALAREMRMDRALGISRRIYTIDCVRAAAEKRFGNRVAPTIACTMADLSYANALFALGFFAPDASTEESIRLARRQIDRLDLCELQIYNTIRDGPVRGAYVENVATVAEGILSRT